jgi:secreted PhoX family phosphatase
MVGIDRRTFLKHSALAAGGLALGPMRALTALGGPQGIRPAANGGGYGPLGPVVDETTGEVLLDLPEGFRYRSFSRTGEVMTDGHVVPPRHDGMAAFPWRQDRTRLIRNHEVFFDPGHIGPADTAYDEQAGGGTSTLEFSANGELRSSWLSINGTNGNCAGGPTPWRSWLTCEETINGPDANVAFTGAILALDEKHGYLFEVPVSQGPGELTVGDPIRAAGRFTHEAVAVDPRTGIVYQTQDDFASPSGFFRYIPRANPRAAGRITDGGLLQVLGVAGGGRESVDLSGNQTVGTSYRVRWIRIEDPDPDFPQGIGNDEAAGWIMREEGIPKGAAVFSRLEGIWFGNGKMFFNSTQGGGPFEDGPSTGFGRGFGQTWMLDLDRQTLTLIFESPGPEVLELPDNITVTPKGNLLLCEDGPADNFMRGLTVQGEIFDFARNVIPGQEGDEFAGATFSPDGQILFVNIQSSAAWSFAIRGPWRRGVL